MSGKLKFGLIGAGGIAQAYAQAFATSQVAELAAVADVVPASANALAAESLPVRRPEASGTRARTPTSRRFASARNRSAGRWRTMLKMIWTVFTCGCRMARRASSTVSTLTP